MNTQNKKSIEENNTLDILDEIQEVKVSPFFKNKVLNHIREQKEEKVILLGWFRPQLQIAAVILVLVMNALTLYYSLNLQDNTQELSGFEAFVQDYSIESTSDIYLN
mgnify:CR=1 FL=1